MNAGTANRVVLVSFLTAAGVITYRAIKTTQLPPTPPQVVRLTLSWSVFGALSLLAPQIAALLAAGTVTALVVSGAASDVVAGATAAKAAPSAPTAAQVNGSAYANGTPFYLRKPGT